jgi:hypothetical protein
METATRALSPIDPALRRSFLENIPSRARVLELAGKHLDHDSVTGA